MNALRRIAIVAFLWTINAQGSIINTLDDPTQTGVVGDTLYFYGTVTNTGPESFSVGFGHSDSGTWPNAFELDFPAGLSTDSGFFAFGPGPGQSFTGELFDIVITPAAAGLSINATSYLYAWPDGSNPQDFNDVIFSNGQTIQVTIAPEPRALWLGVAGLALLLARATVRS